MNDTVTTEPGRRYRQPQHPVDDKQQQRVVRRVGVIDRIALHLGVALITWSRRPRHPRSSLSVAARAEHQLARERLAQARAREEQNYPRFIIR
ncbi:hypothetical protein [Rhodoglobus aureus]|uniref:hypothetical protein n=1 Tax=Rhodoglobus aureus TaxID=191497 RepID=UPI0031DC298E